MKATEGNVKGCFFIEYNRTIDDRGDFSRLICKRDLKSIGIDFDMVQSSVAHNKIKGTVRGLHLQNYPKAEAKIVTCIHGSVRYFVADLRGESETFKKISTVHLNSGGNILEVLYVPEYCACGYQTLEDNTSLLYSMDEYYDKNVQSGVNIFSKRLGFQLDDRFEVIMSDKDKNLAELVV